MKDIGHDTIRWFSDPKDKYTLTVDCPKCNYRVGIICALELIDTPNHYICRRPSNQKKPCRNEWSEALSLELRNKYKELIILHKAFGDSFNLILEKQKELSNI